MERNELIGGVNKPIEQNWIAFVGKKESLKIPYSDVLYIEQAGKGLRIHRDTGTHKIPGHINIISEEVEEPFFRCHSYLIINISRVDVMTKGRVIFDNQQEKYLCKNSYSKTRKKFNQYIRQE